MTFVTIYTKTEPELGTNWILPDGREGAVGYVEPEPRAEIFKVTIMIPDEGARPSLLDHPRTPRIQFP